MVWPVSSAQVNTLSLLSMLIRREKGYESSPTGGSQALRIHRYRDANHQGWRVPHQAGTGVDLRQRHQAWVWAEVFPGSLPAGGRQAMPRVCWCDRGKPHGYIP